MSLTNLETPRLLLQRPALSDLDELAPIYADPDVMLYIGTGTPRTRQQVEESLRWMIQQWDEHGYGLYIIRQKSDNRIIGRGGLIRQTVDGQPEVELAYLLAKQSWGHGFATEAILAIRDHAVQAGGMQRFIALIHPDNTPSKRVAQKAGLSFEKQVILGDLPAEVFSNWQS